VCPICGGSKKCDFCKGEKKIGQEIVKAHLKRSGLAGDEGALPESDVRKPDAKPDAKPEDKKDEGKAEEKKEEKKEEK
jgi:hypothetical protein